MIKINLLPFQERKKKNILQQQLITLGVSCGVFFLLVVSLHLYTVLSIGRLEKEVRTSEEQLKVLMKVAAEMDLINLDKKVLQKKIEIINNLEKTRMALVLLLNDMTLTIPAGQVWLTSLSDTAMNLRLDGFARDNVAVARFMKNLEKSPFIQAVDLSTSKQERIANAKVQRFTINCTLKGG